MHQLETVNEMNTDDGPSAPRNRDHQQQRVDFASVDGDVDRSLSGSYDYRYPGVGFNYRDGVTNVKDPPADFLQTPAQLTREQLTAATDNDTTLTTVSRFGRDFSRLATNTPRNFAALGQTPMTGASLGSTNPTPYSTSAGSGILKSSNYKTATLNALNNDAPINRGISAMGLIRGNNPLGPTPLVRRNDPGKNKQQEQQHHQQQQQLPTPSPGMHYHFPATSDIKTFDGVPPPKKRMSSVEEEDPAMLRYASTAGSDQSPLVAKGSKTEEESEMDKIEASRTPPTQPQTQPGGILRDPSASSFVSGVPPREHQIQPPCTQKAPAALDEFPFFFDGYASWVCRHCNHISPYYRGENYIWHFPQAPPNEFVDMHLIVCPGLNASPESSVIQHQHPQLHHVPPQAPYQQQASYGNKKAGAPDPPTGRSPPPILPKKGGTSDSHAPHYFGQQYPGQPYPHGQPPYSMMPHPQMGAQPPYMAPPPGAQKPPFPFGLSGTADPSPSRKKSKATGKNISPKGRPSDDETYTKAIEHLQEAEDTMPNLTRPDSDIGSSLVESSDSELITDYFFHIMKQLVVCRFAEKDRKTRGGKRENVNIGYGGLQCRHCIHAPSSRKFFWSNVDRLANSFAEIPTHVLKCKSTPDDIRDSLLVLKGRHSEQMQSLARGSQKVFFRRMWRRLHDGDETNGATPISQKPSADDSESGNSDTASNSVAAHPNPARILADTLAAESKKTAALQNAASILARSDSIESSNTVLLAIPEDKDWLSDDHCFVRNNIELFVATQNDCKQAAGERKYPIKPGWVGFRCLHCAKTTHGARDGAVFYPYSVSGIFESVREFQRLHFEKCTNLPPDVVEAYRSVNKASTTLSSVLRRYYVQSARALGLIDFPDGGIKAGAKPEAVSSAGFATSPVKPSSTPDRRSSLVDPAKLLLEMSRKRKAQPDPLEEVHSPTKKQNTGSDKL